METKRGSSRRKGDDFQDLTALKAVLELYLRGKDFQVFLEYEKVEAIDDIVVFADGLVRCIQAKYAVDPLAVYTLEDFTDADSKTYFQKYARGWRKIRQAHPAVQVELHSNRGRDSALADVISPDGRFDDEFILNKRKKAVRAFRKELKSVCEFGEADEADFQAFLRGFHFHLAQRAREELEAHIRGELLDHRLGISDPNVLGHLRDLVWRHAVEVAEPITVAHLDPVFAATQRRFLVPQVFPVEAGRFVEAPSFAQRLRDAINAADGDYVVVTGLPGSGKSTGLTEFFKGLRKDSGFVVARYYCFVDPNDDLARLRLEAGALRVNLLSELSTLFPDLTRRFDFGEQRLASALREIGSSLALANRKLVILLDGLDHAERDSTVRDSVIDALPPALPKGVVIVIGTQELQQWQPLAVREGRAERHVPMPLFQLADSRRYLIERRQLPLDDSAVREIHDKSQGLPLYLNYVAEWIAMHPGAETDLSSIPATEHGDIRRYYDRLWANFETDGIAAARHLCAVLAVLRFPVPEAELIDFQTEVRPVDFPAALRGVRHLLRDEAQMVSIFHDSFRVFVQAKLDDPTRVRIAKAILAKLKTERGSTRWFRHAFRYARDAGDYDYVVAEVNRSFVDFSMSRCRPAHEIHAAIGLAGEMAATKTDLVTLARLGPLHRRTVERLSEQFDYGLFARVHLALGGLQDVLDFSFRQEDRRWLIDSGVALEVIAWCGETRQHELGGKLFQLFRETHPTIGRQARNNVVALGRVVGSYSEHPSRYLALVSGWEFKREMLEREDLFAPGYAPQLESFLDAYFRLRPGDAWVRLKRIRRLFPNQLVRHYLLRLVAAHRSSVDLRSEVEEYLAATPTAENLEIAGYAAMAGLPVARVKALAGNVRIPPAELGDNPSTSDVEKHADRFAWTAVVLGYENDPRVLAQVQRELGRADSLWRKFLHFVFASGQCHGRLAGDPRINPVDAATSAVTFLCGPVDSDVAAYETLRACRPMLRELLGRLTHAIGSAAPTALPSWRDTLLKLRESPFWTTHIGLGELHVDYTFELEVWERQADISGMGALLRPVLQSCAKTYTEALNFKGGQRSTHFLRLAALTARCGWHPDAMDYCERGVVTSLTYGYHKDTTLSSLITVLKLLNPQERSLGLPRAAGILEMAKCMASTTDERMTTEFEEEVFPVVAESSREAAFALIRFIGKHGASWKMQDFLETLIGATSQADPECFWALAESFTCHTTSRREHPKQVLRVVTALRDLGIKIEPTRATVWRERYSRFVRTHIEPGLWPADVWTEVEQNEGRKAYQFKDPHGPTVTSPAASYVVNGITLSRTEVATRLASTVDDFTATLAQLRSANQYFHDRELVSPAFAALVAKAGALADAKRLAAIAEDLEDLAKADGLRAAGHRLYELGDPHGGFACLELAYIRSHSDFGDDRHVQPYLDELCARDPARAAAGFVRRAAASLAHEHGGLDLPRVIARFFLASGNVADLRRVYEDFERHCRELFSHVPSERMFDWLAEHRDRGADENEQIVEHLIDLLADSEIDQAQRTLHALVHLNEQRSELVARVTVRRFKEAEPLLRARLELLIEALAEFSPTALVPHVDVLLAKAQGGHFRLRRMLLIAIKRTGDVSALAPSVATALRRIEHDYSPLVSFRTRRFIVAGPTTEFAEFFRSLSTMELIRQIVGAGKLLGIEADTIISEIEQRLRIAGWSLAEERDRQREEYRRHGRNKRMIWFVSQFAAIAGEHFQAVLHEALVNGSYDDATQGALANVVRLGDPEAIRSGLLSKPADVVSLGPADRAGWLQISTPGLKPVVTTLSAVGWTTVYEERTQGLHTGSHIEFQQIVSRRALLVSHELHDDPENWPDHEEWTGRVPLRTAEEYLSLAGVRDRLALRPAESFDQAEPFIRIVSRHSNGPDFIGCGAFAMLNNDVASEFQLRYEGRELWHENELVARFEDWAEGYEDECYSRDFLSRGCRLVVRNHWLSRLIVSTKHSLAIAEHTLRRHAPQWHAPEKKEEAERTQFWVIGG